MHVAGGDIEPPADQRQQALGDPAPWQPPTEIALASDRLPVDTPSVVAGGITFPTLRIVKRLPAIGGVQEMGKHDAMDRVSEDCTATRVRNCSRESTLPGISFRASTCHA